MNGRSLKQSYSTGIVGSLYAFLYTTGNRGLFGISLRGWLRFAPVAIMAVALLRRWSLIWIILALGSAILIRLLYWKAKRDGYVRFVGQALAPPKGQIELPADWKISLRATGQFSVKDREEYVLLRPADYWRVPKGDHAIMVERRPGRFLYQFIQPGSLQQIEPGMIFFGRRPKRSLAVCFLSSWGPVLNREKSGSYAPSKNGSASQFQRNIYLTFDDEESMSIIWHNLSQDSDQPISEKI